MTETEPTETDEMSPSRAYPEFPLEGEDQRRGEGEKGREVGAHHDPVRQPV